MSTTMHEERWREERLQRLAQRHDDPEVEARRVQLLHALLKGCPNVRRELIDKGVSKGIKKGRLTEARTALRRVLVRRQVALTPEDEARIDACTDLATLERWLDQAVTAANAAEALQ